MEKWFVSMKTADFTQIAEKYHISPIIARLIRNRDILGDQNIDYYLNGTIADLHDGMLMKNMDTAVEILEEKIREGEKIRVIGDYDIDGVNATYILKTGLESLGALVDTDIPDRMKDGYGLNQMLIDRALEDGVDTIITCDNGIAAASEIAYGKAQGMTIIVTDHHEVPYLEAGGEKEYLIPGADAVVNPHLPGDPYPFKGLCGAAVAYKVVEALYNVMGQDADDVDFLMENVAIASVGDVMDLVDENRIFVKQGLEMLKRTRNEGLKALMECTQVPIERLSAYHIGFVIGPCINASGRLDTAKRALELLEVKNRREAVMMAEDLKALNDSRKEMTEKGVGQAVEQIETTDLKEDRVLVVYLPDCHESIAGIIAGRLKEKYYKSSPFELSGGQKRRVAIAGVLAMEPEVLILDEPTAGLDPKGRDEILDQIAYLHDRRKITVFLVSHSMEDIARYVERILVMNKGEKAFDGTPKEVFAHYKELEQIGLAAPQITYIMNELQEAGLPCDCSAITVEEAKASILKALEKRKND